MYPKILSNIDINNILYSFKNKGYLGCVPKDLLTKLKIPKNKKSFAIINSGNSDTGGFHWRAFFNDPKSEYIEWFDSFGVYPDIESLAFLKTTGKKVLYSTSQLQGVSSSACGYYCIYFVLARYKDIPYYDVVMNLNQEGNNEKFIQKFRSLIK